MPNNPLHLSINGCEINHIAREPNQWVIHAKSRSSPICPGCRTPSTSRHSHYDRHLWDLPIQSIPVLLHIGTGRWRCRNPGCSRRIFTEQLPELTRPHARSSRPLVETLRVFGHGAGGRPAERLLGRKGIMASDNTILRHLRRAVSKPLRPRALRVVGIDDWAWTKGQSFGTIMVDLEARIVADVLPDRSASSVSRWLRQHPGVEIVCRDRHGLYAEGTRQGAPQAPQVADRFHLMDNLRERLEQQMSGHHAPIRPTTVQPSTEMPPTLSEAQPADGRYHLLQQFDHVKTLYRLGRTASSIVRATGLSRKRVDKWIRLDPAPNAPSFISRIRSPYAPAWGGLQRLLA
jgi:transposase